MLKSNNFNSVIDDLTPISSSSEVEALRPTTLNLDESLQLANNNIETSPSYNNNNNRNDNLQSTASDKHTSSSAETSIASVQLGTAVLQLYGPPLVKAREQLKELIGKQNKIYIDISAEKYKLDNAETIKLQEMMNNVKLYREKLLKIKKQMQNIYQRTKVLKKRALNIQTCKERELQRKLQKQQQEELLIASNQQNH